MRIDLKKARPDLYRPSTKEFTLVDVPPMRYLAYDGHGDPNTSAEYAAALTALYASGYSIRATFKARTGDDFVVGPLEGLWSADDPRVFAEGAKDEWDWTMMIPLPEQVEDADIVAGFESATVRKPDVPVDEVYVFDLHEGPSLQIMHIGSYDDEAPTLARLHNEVMPAHGGTFNGRHHEVYLSDPRRTAPEKLKTILRHPVKPL